MVPAKPLLLIIDDEESVRAFLSSLAARQGFDVLACESGPEALAVLRRRHVDLTFVDLHMPGMNGLEVLRAIHGEEAATHIALMTGESTIESAVEAVKLGAEDYLQKPLHLPRVIEIMTSVRQGFENRGLMLASDAALAERLEFCGMVGRSRVVSDLFDLIRRLAPHARSVLITGETGSGKELVARALHKVGPRRDKRFVTINCSAVVETLFESELFGHVRGAFTGASEHKAGLFEAANGGTLFLDEVGELPLAVQAKLLRVLESGEVQRVGATQGNVFDVRIIAATNRDLDDDVGKGTFRSDLFYRLNVVELAVPTLRQRREDIPYLTAAFVQQYSTAFEKPISGLTAPAETLLTAHAWPGNVRQLRNIIERACLLCEGQLLTERDIERALGARTPDGSSPRTAARGPVTALPGRDVIVAALAAASGNKAAAAQHLGISRRSLYRLLEKYGVGG